MHLDKANAQIQFIESTKYATTQLKLSLNKTWRWIYECILRYRYKFVYKQWEIILIDLSWIENNDPAHLSVGWILLREKNILKIHKHIRRLRFVFAYFIYLFRFFFLSHHLNAFSMLTINFPVFEMSKSFPLVYNAIATMRDSINVFVCVYE